MELRHWQRDDSESSESGDSGDEMHDENCAGCLRIMKEEEERLRACWRENGRLVEGGTHVKGELETQLSPALPWCQVYILLSSTHMPRAVVSSAAGSAVS